MSGATGRAVVVGEDGSEATTPKPNCGPGVGGQLYINREDMTVSDLSQGMTTTIGMAVDDQVYGVGLVQVTGLEQLARDKQGLYRNTDADSDGTIDPDEDANEKLEYGGPQPYPYISRDTSLSSLTFDKLDLYNREEGGLNQPTAIKLGDESTFDEVYTVNHSPENPPLGEASFPPNIPTGWSFASTRTAPEEKVDIQVGEPLEYLTSLTHLKEVTCGPNNQDVSSYAQNTYSDKSTSRSIGGFATYVYNRYSNYSRKKKASIVAAVCVFLVFISVLFVVGFRYSSGDSTSQGTSIESFNEAKNQQLLPNSDNTSLETNVLLASEQVTSTGFDETQDNNGLPYEADGTANPVLENGLAYNQSSMVPSTTTVTNSVQYNQENSEPIVPLYPLESTPSPIDKTSTSSPSNKLHSSLFDKSHTEEPSSATNQVSSPKPTKRPSNQPTNKPDNTEPIILKPENPRPNNPKPKPSPQVPDPPPPATVQTTPSPSNPPPVSPTLATPVPSFTATNSISPSLRAASSSIHPTPRNPVTTETETQSMPPTKSTGPPSAIPTSSPSTHPTSSPSVHPTEISTPEPTINPTSEPTPEPTPDPTPLPTPRPTDCLDRKFYYNRNNDKCTNDESEGEYDTPWDCCEVHFRDVHCQFKDICDYYIMRPTPEPTPDPTPEPVEVSVSEPAGEETKREDEPDRGLRRPLMLV